MNFQIMQQVGGKEFVPATDLIFSCPKKAAVEAQRLSQIKGIKCQPRPIRDSANHWMDRERQRFTDGKYKPVIWAGQEWWDRKHNPAHFVHVSIKNPSNIAFTKSDMDGAKDIQTSMKPGKYLTEFFSKVLTAEQIRTYAVQQSLVSENKELNFARTPEEIQHVYAADISGSCFSGTTKANLYGSGDFAVAYIENEDGEITARVLCCPERKIYNYPYGDRERLTQLMESSGYTDTGYDDEPWKGLRLLKKWHWRNFYTDFGGSVEPHPTDKDYLVIA